MRVCLVFVVVFFICVSGAPRATIFDVIVKNYDPDIYRNVSELITSKGYPVEEHKVTTSDGYVLSMQRIPHGRNESFSGLAAKKVVLLIHGLFGTADNYVFNFPDQSLAFILADNGYDVWLGNVRGTVYSKDHVDENVRLSDEFWNFSFDEMSDFDLPAMIDYTLDTTGQESLSYVGHSQGTLMAFALLSEKPEYNEKINLFAAMAPIVYLGHMEGINRFLCEVLNEAGWILGNREIFGNSTFLMYVKEFFCDTFAKPVCEGFFFEIFGDDKQLNKTRLPVYAGHFPASTSTKNLVHFGQLVESSTFRKFDYGEKENMKRYGQKTPPEWDVSRITAPVAFFWSLNDTMANPTDVAFLKTKISNLVDYYQVPFDGFLHVDFVLAYQANTLVYNEILKLLPKL